ncbi:MAG: WD40 repeat domain-containing protein, partial [Fuerstia sp.]|nr:WD40 repeat domain-containing protein [Fuerstiella sp.]
WLSCMARADWSFTRSIPCASAIAALSPSGELLAELADPAGAQQICIRSLADPSSSTLCAPAGLDVKAIWFSRAGGFLVATDLQSNWQIFRTRDGRKLFDIPQLALGCDLCDATEQIVFWHVTPVVMLATLNGDVSTPPFRTFDLTSPAPFVRFSPDGRQLAILDRPGSAKLTLMNTSDGRITGVQPAHQAILLAWSPDGQLIAMPNQSGNITIRDVASSRIVSTLSSNESVISAITWHPSGNYLITTSWTGETLLRHVWTGRTLVRSHESLDAIAFSDDGQRIGWQFQSGSLKIAEWTPGHVIDLPWNSQNNTERPAGICIHPEGRLAIVYSLAGCQLFDLETASVLHRIPLEGTLAAEFSDTGDGLVVLTRTTVMHWPIRNGVGEETIEFPIGPPLKVPVPSLQNGVIATDGRTALVRTTAAADRLTLLQLSDGAELWQAGDSAPGLDVARLGQFAVRRGWRAAQAEVYDFATGNRLAVLNVGGGSVPSASPDSKYFVSSSLHQLQFWNPQTWQPLDAMPLDSPVVGASAMFHPLESLMVVRLMPSRLGLIDPATRNVIARVDELQDYWNTANAFSPDGKYFTELSGDPCGARVWKLGHMRRTLAQHGLDWDGADSAVTTHGITPPFAEVTARPIVVRLEVTNAVQPGPGDSLRSARDELLASPSDPRLQNMVAWRLLMAPAELRNDTEALELARRCVAAVPDSAADRNTLGLACYRNGLHAEAEQLLLKNLRTSRPEDLTLDLIILSMIAWINHQPAASDSFITWAENNFAEHPPADAVGLDEIQRLFRERTDLTKKAE